MEARVNLVATTKMPGLCISQRNRLRIQRSPLPGSRVLEQTQSCVDVNYEGETSHSLAERFGGHMSMIKTGTTMILPAQAHVRKPQRRDTAVEYGSLEEVPGDPALRQATEAVSIRVNKPAMNGKEEWTNEPRRLTSIYQLNDVR